MSATTTAPTRTAGERVELGRYCTAAGERIVIGQRVCGVVRVSDVPARGRGRRYLVERALTSRGELDALVADYLLCRRRHNQEVGTVPRRGRPARGLPHAHQPHRPRAGGVVRLGRPYLPPCPSISPRRSPLRSGASSRGRCRRSIRGAGDGRFRARSGGRRRGSGGSTCTSPRCSWGAHGVPPNGAWSCLHLVPFGGRVLSMM
jgi:hypothetical protein